MLLAGTLPGVIVGSVIRVYLLPGPVVFDLVVAAVLMPLGIWLALSRPAAADGSARRIQLPAVVTGLIAAAAGCVGGITPKGDFHPPQAAGDKFCGWQPSQCPKAVIAHWR